MKLMAKFNLILIVLFGLGGFVISRIAYDFLLQDARRQVLQQAELMLASAKAVRDYTSSNVEPLLSHKLSRGPFHPEAIPFFAATTAFNKLKQDYPAYEYREPALNPTNMEDRANDWEADVIRMLRKKGDNKSLPLERETPAGSALYLAEPIKVDAACLECHSVPSAAPASMVALYGKTNGFGWKPQEIVGAQIISVPMSVPIAIAQEFYHRLLLYLVITLLITLAALDVAVYLTVVKPLKLVSASATRVSTGEKDVPPLPVKGNDEIAMVTAAFNRMQVSLIKAFKLLDQ